MKRAPRKWLLVALGIASIARAASVAPPEAAALERYQRPAAPPFPADNAWTPERAELGRVLFFDPRLSRSGITACATCHNPGLSWGDGLPRAVGHAMKELPRRTPTVLNLAWGELYFWDGRAASLEEQALGPIASPDEMNLTLEEMVARVASIPAYAPLFATAYPVEPISARTVARAIATFERTLVSGPAPFDAWVAGDASAVSTEARRGFALFEGKANCAVCHTGWRFTDDAFYDIGLPGDDLGRGKHLPGIDVAQYAFKTPTLRNVTRRAPYMHDGSEATLTDVIELYDRGGRVRRPSLSAEIRPLGLSAHEKRDLLAFLHTLTSDDAPTAVPALPEVTMHVFYAAFLSLLLAAAASAEDYTVLQKDKLFSQATIDVHAGDSVTFSNRDNVTHNVFSVSPGNTFEIKTQLPGKSSTVSFSNPGVAEVRCAIHPTMKLTVNVQP